MNSSGRLGIPAQGVSTCTLSRHAGHHYFNVPIRLRAMEGCTLVIPGGAGVDTPPDRHAAHAKQQESNSVGTWLTFSLAAFGIILRIRQYVFHRSLWNDEAALAINIINRSYGGLTHKLAVEQGAPIGFLWLEKTATELFGNSEYSLRLVPLLAGIASVLLFGRLAARVLPPVASHLALGLFAISPSLVYYASESKQYGFDVFAAVALVSFSPWLLEGELSWRKCGWWGATAAVLIWCSFPAVFVAGAVSLVVALMKLYGRHWIQCLRYSSCCAVWILSLISEYFITLRSLHSDPHLLGYWEFAFPPRPLEFSTTEIWLRQDLHVIVGFPWDLKFYALTIVLILAGLILLTWRRPPIGALLFVLGGTVAVAAIAHGYPMADRLVLFTVPVVCLLLGSVLLLSPRLPLQILLIGLVLVISANEIGTAASAVVHPYTKTEVREAYVYVLQHQRPGDGVLVEWEGVPDFVYYHQTLGVTGDGTIRLTGSPSACDNRGQLAQLQKWKRVWLVFGIDPNSEIGRPVAHYISAFRSIARVGAIFNSPGPSAAVLLTVNQRKQTIQPTIEAPPWSPGSFGCISISISPVASLVGTLGPS